MPAAGTSTRFRRRQLNFKTHIAIVRENELDETQTEVDLDGEGAMKPFRSGVDENEERVCGMFFHPNVPDLCPTMFPSDWGRFPFWDFCMLLRLESDRLAWLTLRDTGTPFASRHQSLSSRRQRCLGR